MVTLHLYLIKDEPAMGTWGKGIPAEGTASAEAPRENKLQWGKWPREEGPGMVTQKAGVAWPQALGAGFAPPSHLWLLRGQPCLSPWALSGFTASQLCDPRQVASPLVAFALCCLAPVLGSGGPWHGGGAHSGSTAAALM